MTAGGIAILPSIDAIQEFKVLTYNYSADTAPVRVRLCWLTTKSGSNQFHGSLFEFFRNTVLDARSYFATEREKFNLNQYGGALGGPIRKDKTFFFIDYQGGISGKGFPSPGWFPRRRISWGISMTTHLEYRALALWSIRIPARQKIPSNARPMVSHHYR